VDKFSIKIIWRRLILICTLGAFAGIVVIGFHPVSSKMLNSAFLACVMGAWMGIMILTWKRKAVRTVAFSLPVLVAIPFLLPSGEIDAGEIRQNYVQRMAEFEGTKYHWGGEGERGIDCSGLPRRALRDALWVYGAKHANGRAFRMWIEQWWFDASAHALSQGYRGYTVPLTPGGTIHEMDYASLIPGDLAVTTNGVHILAYAGNGQWIQADPGIGAVATLHGKSDENLWFHTPVTTHRWHIFARDTKAGAQE